MVSGNWLLIQYLFFFCLFVCLFQYQQTDDTANHQIPLEKRIVHLCYPASRYINSSQFSSQGSCILPRPQHISLVYHIYDNNKTLREESSKLPRCPSYIQAHQKMKGMLHLKGSDSSLKFLTDQQPGTRQDSLFKIKNKS